MIHASDIITNAKLARFAHSILDGNGWVCALHVDRSGDLTVAGCLFDAARLGDFCEQWNAALSEYGLLYFDMPLDTLKPLDRVKVQARLVGLINIFSADRFVRGIENNTTTKGKKHPERVSEAVTATLDWANSAAHSGDIAFIFESGACCEGFIDAFASYPKSARYAGHGFVPLSNNPGGQAAGILAWQHRHEAAS